MMTALREALSAMRALREPVGIPAALAAGAVTIALLSATPAAAQGPEDVAEALKKGDLAEAKTLLGQAVKRNPADYDAVLSYASTLSPKEALKIADSISRAPNTPGWAKARGMRFSGDHLFLKEDYKKAADAYLQASLLDSGSSTYKHLYALSIAMDGRTEAAKVIWNGIALDKNNELNGEAARLLALLPKPVPAAADTETLKLPAAAPVSQQTNTQGQTAAPVNTQNNTQVSTSANPNAVKADSVKTPSAPAVQLIPTKPKTTPANTSAAATVAFVYQPNNTAKADSAKTPSKPAEPTAPVNPPAQPVNQQTNIVKIDSAKTQPTKTAPNNPPASTAPNAAANMQAAPADSKPAGPAFTIQVGAFASKENVENLVRRLTGKYDDITVSATGSGDQTLYRVRVGTFQKKEDATAFADKLIIEAGLSARVTEK
jgi:cell division septation protein DedD